MNSQKSRRKDVINMKTLIELFKLLVDLFCNNFRKIISVFEVMSSNNQLELDNDDIIFISQFIQVHF